MALPAMTLLRFFAFPALLAMATQAQEATFVRTQFPGTATAMMEDDEGALWVGAEEGVFRFDGTRFLKIDLGLGNKEHIVRSVAKAKDGSVWATSVAGLHRIRMRAGQPADVSRQRESFGIGVDIWREIVAHVEGDGNGGELAVGLYENGRLRMHRYSSVYFSGPPRFAADGSLVGACGDAVCVIAPASVAAAARGEAPRPTRYHLPMKSPGRTAALQDREGCLWFRSALRAGYRCPADTGFQMLAMDLAEATQFNYLGLDPLGEIWLLSDGGLVSHGRPGRFQTLDRRRGVPRHVECLAQLTDGSIWMGGVGELFRFIPPERLEHWTERNGLTLSGLVVRRGGNGAILVGGSHGLLRLSADRSRWEPFGDQRLMRFVSKIFPSPLGTTLVASALTGVMELDGEGAVLHRSPRAESTGEQTQPTGLNRPSATTSRLLTEGSSVLYASSRDGLNIRQESDFARDDQGRLWNCTTNGLIRVDSRTNQWTTWRTQDGLLYDACRSVAVAPDGREIWQIYQINAMSRLRFNTPDRFAATHYRGDTERGLHFAQFIQFDQRGWLWRGGAGIHVADSGRDRLENWITLNEQDGVPETQPDLGRSFFGDRDGSIWILSPDRLIRFVPPADLFSRKRTPSVFLASAPARERLRGAPVRFEFGSLYYELRNQLRFRYRLGSDQPWVETRETAVSRSDLPPGEYRFQLAARVAPYGEWTAPIVYPFQITVPAWQSPWTAGAFGLSGLTAAAGLWAMRRKRQLAYLRQKQAFRLAIDQPGIPVAPDVQRLLRHAQTSPHLPDLSPWTSAGVWRQPIPRCVGERFEVESQVAAGGFAAVYAARDRQRGGARSAIKIFLIGKAERQWLLRRFEQEIEALRRIDHPGVVPFLDAGETENGDPYLAMDFVEGQTLRKRLIAGPLPRQQAATLTRQLGAALAAIHQAGVFHRDIKPENLMLGADGRLVVIDFSIAIARDPRATQHALSRAAGSLLYMAPEQVFGFAAPGTDIYSFALVVFELLTGQRAGDLGLGSSSGSLPEEIRQSLRELCPDLPPADVLAEALVTAVSERPGDAAHFGERLAAWILS
jgi:hypothetical protein